MTPSELLRTVALLYGDARELSSELAGKRREVENAVGQARDAGLTWAAIAKAAGVSEQAVMKAAKRYYLNQAEGDQADV